MADIQGFGGLGGATKWQSVGLQYVASQLPLGNEHRGRILARAVEVDPGNRMAQLSYWNDRYRRAASRDELSRYTALLAAFVQPIKSFAAIGGDALLLRALYSLVAASVNLKELGGVAPNLQTHMTLLKKQLKECLGTPETRDLAQEMQCAVETLEWSGTNPAAPEAPSGWTFVGYFNAACFWASRKPLTPAAASQAVEYLIRAGDGPSLVSSRTSDPQLKPLLTNPVYIDRFGTDVETDILTAIPFAAHAQVLQSAILTTSKAISRVTPWDLQSLGIRRPIAERLHKLAVVHAALHRDVAAWGVPIVNAMAELGLTDKPDNSPERIQLVRLVLDATASAKSQPRARNLFKHLR
jgi:hypothetical protein